MASVNLYQKFDWTDAAGNLYSDGSTSTAKTVTVAGGEIFDRTYKVTGSGSIKRILRCGPAAGDNIGSFDFLWIESDQEGEIQLLCNEDGVYNTGSSESGIGELENGFCVKLLAGVPFVLTSNHSRTMGDVGDVMDATTTATTYGNEVDTWEDDWPALMEDGTQAVIDRIEFLSSASNTTVRIVAIT